MGEAPYEDTMLSAMKSLILLCKDLILCVGSA